ncbi:MAG: GNAT family N-acetyltransferase [Lentisphaeria bacterium]|nr:GNAT family N-acetyltransferase [Lentisphaeria bacterium]
MIEYSIFNPAQGVGSCAGNALDQLLVTESPEKTYSQMMRYRLAGNAAGDCRDVYFIATENGECVSRLWHGWGRHADSIGNFGNFRTAESYKKRGIGRRLLSMWFEDLLQTPEKPLGLFCTSSELYLIDVYGKFGFRPALPEGPDGTPLYCPLGDSPATFREFCEQYYAPVGGTLRFIPGSVGYRHEIDCLLKFSLLLERGETLGLPSQVNCEAALLHPGNGKLEYLALENDHIVGWSFTPENGEREVQLHPAFREMYCDLY